MFFRCKSSPSGHVLQLIQSLRDERNRPRQKVVLSLGNAEINKSDQPLIARGVQIQLSGEEDLFRDSYSPQVSSWIQQIVRRLDSEHALRRRGSAARTTPLAYKELLTDEILIDEVGLENAVELGPQLVGLHAWGALEMDRILEEVGLNPTQRTIAAISVISRLCDPSSEHALQAWMDQTALPEIVGHTALGKGDDRFYRVSDALLRNAPAIEAHLRQRQASLFDLDQSILLYDLTNTHFEGLCPANPKAKRGKNKQGRDDCAQIVVGIVFDSNGFALTHKIFAGNQHDAKSLPEMVKSLRAQMELLGKSSPQMLQCRPVPMVIVDGGIASTENLALLRAEGFDYLVNDSRRRRGRYAREFSEDQTFSVITDRQNRQPVRVRLLQEKHDAAGSIATIDIASAYDEQVVLCKSDARGLKEQAILSNAEKRFLEHAAKLAVRIEKGTLCDEAKIQQAIGKLKAQHHRVQRYYDIELTKNEDTLVLRYQQHQEEIENARNLTGCYVLRTNRSGLDASELWRLYMTLLNAEDGFRSLKSDLGLRPNFHQKESRVDGHVFITILAYQLWCFIRMTLRNNNDQRSWETIRRVLRTHCYATIVLPTKTGKTYRIRRASAPDQSQQQIYQLFDIDCKTLPRCRTLAQ